MDARTFFLLFLSWLVLGPRPSAVAQPAPRDSLEAERLFIRGLLQQELENHDEAIALFEQALHYLPEQPAILSSLAASYAHKEQYEEAFQYAQRALLQDSTSIYYYTQNAELALKAGYTAVARDLYETIIQRFHAPAEVYLQLAQLYVANHDYSSAIDIYERLLSRGEVSMHVYYQLLRLYEGQHNLAAMTRILERMYRLQPENQAILNKLIEAYEEQDNLETAIALLEKALHDRPNDLELILKLSDLYKRTGALQQAEQLNARFLNLTDDAPEWIIQKAEVLQSQGTPEALEEAIQLLRNVLEMHPEHAQATYLLGRLLYQQGSYAEAAPFLEQAVRTHIRDLSLWQEAVAAYLQAGNPRQALALAERGLMLFPGQIPLLYLGGTAALQMYQNKKARALLEEARTYLQEEEAPSAPLMSQILASLALLYTRENAYTRADSAYEAALRWTPDEASILNNYAYSLAERGIHLDKAREMAQQAVNQDPENPAYLDTLGWIYYKMKHYTKARTLVEKAIRLQPEKALYYEHLGDILMGIGARTEAIMMYRKALEQAPDRESLKQKLNRLEQQ